MDVVTKDPVCGMEVSEESAAGKSEYKGKVYLFCSTGCKKAFDENPERYLSESSSHTGHHHHG